MPWTTVAKPTGANWTNVSKPTGANYTNVAKPSGGSLIEVGFAFGTLGMTYSVQEDASPWNLVPKPLD